MIAIIAVRMIMYAAITEVKNMCDNDEGDSRDEQPGMIGYKKLFQDEEGKTRCKNQKR